MINRRPRGRPVTVWTAILAMAALAVVAEASPKSLKTFAKLLRQGSLDVRMAIGDTMGELGLGPGDVIPLLESALRDRDARSKLRQTAASACVGLARLGAAEPLVPVLVEALEDEDGFVQGDARRALGHIGEAAAPAMPALMRAMAREEGHYGYLLSVIRGIGAPAVPFLLDGLSSDPPRVRAISAAALAGHTERPEVRAPLLAALEDADLEVRLEAAEGVFRLRPWDQEIVDAISARLDDPEPAVVVAALKVLRTPIAKSATEKIRSLLEHEDAEVRQAAVVSLRRIGVDLESSTGALIVALDDPSQRVRTDAALSLAKTAPDTPGLVDVLREGLDMQSAYTIECIAGLARLGRRARPAAGELLVIVERFPSDLIQSNAATALAAMAPMPELVPKLTRLLPAASPRLSVWLWYAIAQNDPARDAEAVAAIALVLGHEGDDSIVSSAIAALARLGPRAKAALPELRALEARSEGNVRKWCQQAITQINVKVA